MCFDCMFTMMRCTEYGVFYGMKQIAAVKGTIVSNRISKTHRVLPTKNGSLGRPARRLLSSFAADLCNNNKKQEVIHPVKHAATLYKNNVFIASAGAINGYHAGN